MDLEVKVLVPGERLTDFYRWFADWLDGEASVEVSADASAHDRASESRAPEPKAPGLEHDAAVRWWRSLKQRERQIWALWIEAAPKAMTAEEIVAALGLSSTREIPGVLSWSGRKGQKAGFEADWKFEYDPAGTPLYGLTNVGDVSAVEYAQILRAARAEAEG